MADVCYLAVLVQSECVSTITCQAGNSGNTFRLN